jgi:hypothetical protein
MGAATLAHVGYAGLLTLSPQEAYYWEWARRLDLSYFDHPPLAAWTIALTTGALGDSERSVRLAAALHSAIFCVFFWLAVLRLFGARVALAALAAGLSIPLFALGQVIITPDAPLLSGWAMALYFTVRALDEERPEWLLAAGAATGWALGKYGAATAADLLALVLDPRGRRMPARRGRGPARRSRRLVRAGRRVEPPARPRELRVPDGGARRALVVPAGARRPLRRPQTALVTPILLVLAVEGVAQAVRRRADSAFRLCAIFSAPLLLLAIAISPFHWVKGNWLAPVYPTAFAAAAALAVSRGGWRRRAGFAGVALALGGSVYVHVVPLWPQVPFPARDEGSAGWRSSRRASRRSAPRSARARSSRGAITRSPPSSRTTCPATRGPGPPRSRGITGCSTATGSTPRSSPGERGSWCSIRARSTRATGAPRRAGPSSRCRRSR